MNLRILVCSFLICAVGCSLNKCSIAVFEDPKLTSIIESFEDGQEALIILKILTALTEKGIPPNMEPVEGKPYNWAVCVEERYRELGAKGVWKNIKNKLLDEEMEARREYGKEHLTDEEFFEWLNAKLAIHQANIAALEAEIDCLKKVRKQSAAYSDDEEFSNAMEACEITKIVSYDES